MNITFSVILAAVVLSQVWLIIHVLESLPDKSLVGVEVADCDVEVVRSLRTHHSTAAVPHAPVTTPRPTTTVPKPRVTRAIVKTAIAPWIVPKAPKRHTIKRPDEIFRSVPVTPPIEFGTTDRASFFQAAESTDLPANATTEAYCVCYDNSCTMYFKNAVVKRESTIRYMVRPLVGSNRQKLQNVSRNCRNSFPYCDNLTPSVYCSGHSFEISSKEISTSSPLDWIESIFITSRAGALPFPMLVYPRGIMLNWALRQLFIDNVCNASMRSWPSGQQDCLQHYRQHTTTLLMTDYRGKRGIDGVGGWIKAMTKVTQDFLQQHLQFADPSYFPLKTHRAGHLICIVNRILTYEGPTRDKIVEAVDIIRKVPAEVPPTVNASEDTLNVTTGALNASSIQQDAVNASEPLKLAQGEDSGAGEPQDVQTLPVSPIYVENVVGKRRSKFLSKFVDGLIPKLPVMLGRPVVSEGWMNLRMIPKYSYFVTHDGGSLSFMLFANPGTTWITVYDYRPEYESWAVRNELRTWLIRKDCRFVAYMITDDQIHAGGLQAGDAALFTELAKPYSNSITVITHDSVRSCDSLVSCANVFDYSLIVDTRGMTEAGN